MDVRPIRTEGDYEWALREIAPYFEEPPARGTPEGDRFDVLATLVAAYEREHHPMPDADPVEILRFAIQDMGRSQADLGKLLGSRARASEVLARKRPLTLSMIRAVSAAWNIPVEVLAQPYDLAVTKAGRSRSTSRKARRAA